MDLYIHENIMHDQTTVKDNTVHIMFSSSMCVQTLLKKCVTLYVGTAYWQVHNKPRVFMFVHTFMKPCLIYKQNKTHKLTCTWLMTPLKWSSIGTFKT